VLPGERCTVAQMIAELLRDAAVLVAVFAPLDFWAAKLPLTLHDVGIIVALVLVLAVAGILMEVKRQ
jgi:hypothetical protein